MHIEDMYASCINLVSLSLLGTTPNRNLVPSDGESDTTSRPSDGSRCIPPLRRLLYHASWSCDASRCILRSPLRHQASFTLRPECGDVYAPSERHLCYTLRRGCSYAVAIYTTPGDVYAFLRPIATCGTLIYVSFEILSLITIQSLLRIDRLPLHWLHHYRILRV
jgi:hypothetical protein